VVPGAPRGGRTGQEFGINSSPNTATTLYDIDSTLDHVVIQSPANSGLLAPTGKLGFNTSPAVGFASLNVGDTARFFQVTSSDGAMRSLGAFTGNDVSDIAVPPGQS